jgi:ribosome-binding protein aMBF1 (putative translation factor)
VSNLAIDSEDCNVFDHLDSVIEEGYAQRHKKLAKLMRETRQATGLKQSELAERLDVTQSWVSKMESGSNHTLDNLVDYFEAMGYKVKLTVYKPEEIEL